MALDDPALRAMAEQLIHEQLWDKKHNAWVTIPTAEKLITNALRTVREAQRERDAGIAEGDPSTWEGCVDGQDCGSKVASAIRQPEGR